MAPLLKLQFVFVNVLLGYVIQLDAWGTHTQVEKTTPPPPTNDRVTHFTSEELYGERKFTKVKAINKTSFTQEEKDLILRIHNAYRSVVEPPAADMREMIWDDDLEEYAYNVTQSCTGAHSDRTMVKKWVVDEPRTWRTWTYMGENLYYHYAPDYSIEQALHMFFREGKDYDIETGSCTNFPCAHYIIMATAKSYRVGCSINTCKEFSASAYPTPANFMACSYNGQYYTGVKPYTVGERCSHCTKAMLGYQFQLCRHGLCISPEQYIKKEGYDGDLSVIGLQEDPALLALKKMNSKRRRRSA